MSRFYKLVVMAVVILTAQTAQALTVPANLMEARSEFYNGSFSSARSKIEAYIASNPASPYGYLYRGMMNEWYQSTMNKAKTYNASIMGDFQKANDLAEDQLAADSKNVDKKALVGITAAYVAKKQVDLGRKLTAGSTLKRAKAEMEEVLKTSPQTYEAYFVSGMFNYFCENVPSGLKWLSVLLGFKGDIALGISQIDKAASNENIAKVDAKYVLSYIYSKKERQWEKAYGHVSALYQAYPGNLYFLYDTAEMGFRTKRIAESRANFEKMFDYCSKNTANCDASHLFLANYFYAWSFVDENKLDVAKPYIIKAYGLLSATKDKDRIKMVKDWYSKVGGAPKN